VTDEGGSVPLDAVIRRLGIVSWSLLGILILIAVAVWLVIQGRIILAPLLLAVILVFILNPLVVRLHDRGIHRLVGAAIAFAVIVVGIVVVGVLVVPGIAEQAEGFASTFPKIFDDTTRQIEQLIDRFGFDQLHLWRYAELRAYLSDPANRDLITEVLLSRLGTVTSGIFEVLLIVTLGPVLAFYLLIDLPRVQEHLLALVPDRLRDEVAFVGRELNVAVGGFLKGQLVVAIIVGMLLSVGYWIIGVPFWLLIGLVGGLLNIVPFLGPWVGGALGVLVALATRDPITALWALVVAVVVQQIDNNFVSPSVLRATVRLHPALTLLVLVAGGAVAGVWGVVIAVPTAAALKVLLGHWWRTRILGETWEEASEALIEGSDGQEADAETAER